MAEMTLCTGPDVPYKNKLGQLKARGLMDTGLVLVNYRRICHGYLPETELEFALEIENDAKW
jgi:chloride channel 3/4/5